MQSGEVAIGRFKPEGFLDAAFLPLLPTPELFRSGDVDSSAVLIPSAPVPVNGSLRLVPHASVRKADRSVAASMSMTISMGVTGPQFF